MLIDLTEPERLAYVVRRRRGCALISAVPAVAVLS
jgi:hypothetical protein